MLTSNILQPKLDGLQLCNLCALLNALLPGMVRLRPLRSNKRNGGYIYAADDVGMHVMHALMCFNHLGLETWFTNNNLNYMTACR
jgi:hypothetical protein